LPWYVVQKTTEQSEIMSERHKTHNGRDVDGHFRVKRADVDELLESPEGVDYLRDDVRLSGAVADEGPTAGQRGEQVERLIDENRDDVARSTGRRSKRKR
jgi:hypothetical protein